VSVTTADQLAKITQLESELDKSQAASASATQELIEFKNNLEKSASNDGDDAATLSRKLATIESELSSSRRSTEEARARAEICPIRIPIGQF